LESLTGQLRSIRGKDGDDKSKVNKEQQDFKAHNFPYFTLGEFKDNYLVNSNFSRTKFIVLDADHLGEQLDEIKESLKKDQKVFIVFTSPRGDGLKIVCELAEYVTSLAEFGAAFELVASYFERRYKIIIDTGASGAARACYLSYDPDLYINPDHELFDFKIDRVTSSAVCKIAKNASEFSFKGVGEGKRRPAATELIGRFIREGWKKDFILEFMHTWNEKNIPPLEDDELNSLVEDMDNRYADILRRLPVRFKAKDNCYIRPTAKEGERTVTTFIVEPKELLELPDNDCLRCDIQSHQGNSYYDVLIENHDWHSKAKLLKAIGHQDCSFVGNDQEVQALCAFVNAFVSVRKKGTKVIGLHDNTWVVKGRNITAKEDQVNPTIIPYDKGSDAFLNRITYGSISGEDQKQFLKAFYTDILSINDHKVIAPVIGWSFAAPMKPIIMKLAGSFPLLFMHGGQGSGKTTTAKLILRMNGYRDPEPNRCSMKPFPMLKLLSSTNAIPIMLDEFKVSDLKQDTVDNILRTMRQVYTGELESKGRPDQTIQDYKLEAPLAVIGEWSINQPAIKERIIFARFSDVIKKDEKMQLAFSRIRELPLEAFMPGYVSFCLGQDVKQIYEESATTVKEHFKGRTIAPRILHNISVMVLGLLLFERYGTFNGLDVPQIDLNAVLDAQLEEITGNKTGFVLSAVDQLINELSVYAQKSVLLSLGETWHKIAVVQKKSVIAIRFNQIFPLFKEYAHRTHYEGDLLDKESYMKLFDECDYIVDKQHGVKFDKILYRSLCIDVDKAKAAGIDLEGFGIPA
jgi:hypothetical protein